MNMNRKKLTLILVCAGLMGYIIVFHKTWIIRNICPGLILRQGENELSGQKTVNSVDFSDSNGVLEEMELLMMEFCSPVLLYNYNYGTENKTLYTSSQVSVVSPDELANAANESDNGNFSVSNAQVQEGDGSVQIQDGISIPTIGAAELTGTAYTREQLADFQFMMDHCYTVDSTTYVDENEMNADTLLSMDMTMQQDNSDYQILIYHTHSSSETFADSRPGVLEDTPIGLGDTLTELLEGYGYKVYHDRTVYDQIDGKVDRNYAYTASGEGIDKILAEHPSIEVIIDLHRDGVSENTHLVTEINGKPTAKIMFFNGVSRTVTNGELTYLENPNRQANLAFSLQLYLAGEAAYDDYLRNIYIKGYQYNLNRRPKATLIEVGGQTNTVEEANNAMEPLAYILNEVLSGESQSHN